jgi:hypothetical protein
MSHDFPKTWRFSNLGRFPVADESSLVDPSPPGR